MPLRLMPAESQRHLRADARRNREKVVAATRALLGEIGFTTQMDDVADRAQVGVGTVYRHFPTKDALFGEIVKEAFEAFRHEIYLAREEINAGEDPLAALAAALRRTGAISATDKGVQDALMYATPGMMKVAESADRRLQAITGEVIALARAAGAIRPDAQTSDIGMLMRGVCSTQRLRARADHQDDWRRHLEIVIDGLRPRPAAPPPTGDHAAPR